MSEHPPLGSLVIALWLEDDDGAPTLVGELLAYDPAHCTVFPYYVADPAHCAWGEEDNVVERSTGLPGWWHRKGRWFPVVRQYTPAEVARLELDQEVSL